MWGGAGRAGAGPGPAGGWRVEGRRRRGAVAHRPRRRGRRPQGAGHRRRRRPRRRRPLRRRMAATPARAAAPLGAAPRARAAARRRALKRATKPTHQASALGSAPRASGSQPAREMRGARQIGPNGRACGRRGAGDRIPGARSSPIATARRTVVAGQGAVEVGGRNDAGSPQRAVGGLHHDAAGPAGRARAHAGAHRGPLEHHGCDGWDGDGGWDGMKVDYSAGGARGWPGAAGIIRNPLAAGDASARRARRAQPWGPRQPQGAPHRGV
jgi:hypothetical protein